MTWSDGVPVDATDLLLAWAANSGSLNTKGFDASRYNDDDGRFTGAFPKGSCTSTGSAATACNS